MCLDTQMHLWMESLLPATPSISAHTLSLQPSPGRAGYPIMHDALLTFKGMQVLCPYRPILLNVGKFWNKCVGQGLHVCYLLPTDRVHVFRQMPEFSL